MLADEVERRKAWAHHRLALRAAPGVVLVVVTLSVGATRVPEAAGLGSGDRPGSAISWLALAGVVGALAWSCWADRPGSAEASVLAICGGAVVAITLWSGVTAEGATPWPLVGVLGACWIVGVAVSALDHLRDDQRVDVRRRSERRLAALRHRARQATIEDGPDAA